MKRKWNFKLNQCKISSEVNTVFFNYETIPPIKKKATVSLLLNYKSKIMIKDTVLNYKLLVDNLGNLINISGYRNDFIAKKMGIKPTTFSVKKQKTTWTIEEVEKLLSVIENEETEDYFLGLLMESLEQDETITLAQFKKEVGWK